jgi:hypothetical protein
MSTEHAKQYRRDYYKNHKEKYAAWNKIYREKKKALVAKDREIEKKAEDRV